ncbi:MAG: hypothetical protein ABIW38_03390 [Ferruginibacter sp.]
MPVRRSIKETDGVYFITITCARWLPLFNLTPGYDIVYNWFDNLKLNGHYIIGYVIMPDHLHAIIAFRNSGKSINTIVGNGKRFMAYELVKRLKKGNHQSTLDQMRQWVNKTDKERYKIHEVFEPSFDWKNCYGPLFLEQKLNYIHYNPCKTLPALALHPWDYLHSSATYYITGEQGIYEVLNLMQLHEINLSK